MCAVAVRQDLPKEGETLKIVYDLYGGNHPNGCGKIRIWAPVSVRILSIRPKRVTDPLTKQIINEFQIVTLVNISTGEEYPPVKMGAVLHAAGLVPREDNEGCGFFLERDLRSETPPEELPEKVSPIVQALAELKEQLEAEEAKKAATRSDPLRRLRFEVGEPYLLERALVCRDAGLLAPAGATAKVVSKPARGFLTIEVDGSGPHYIIRVADLFKACCPSGDS